LKESLRNVHDPELGYSVIDLGLIRDVVKEENRAVITMILTDSFLSLRRTYDRTSANGSNGGFENRCLRGFYALTHGIPK
jgi:hypothetical protein